MEYVGGLTGTVPIAVTPPSEPMCDETRRELLVSVHTIAKFFDTSLTMSPKERIALAVNPNPGKAMLVKVLGSALPGVEFVKTRTDAYEAEIEEAEKQLTKVLTAINNGIFSGTPLISGNFWCVHVEDMPNQDSKRVVMIRAEGDDSVVIVFGSERLTLTICLEEIKIAVQSLFFASGEENISTLSNKPEFGDPLPDGKPAVSLTYVPIMEAQNTDCGSVITTSYVRVLELEEDLPDESRTSESVAASGRQPPGIIVNPSAPNRPDGDRTHLKTGGASVSPRGRTGAEIKSEDDKDSKHLLPLDAPRSRSKADREKVFDDFYNKIHQHAVIRQRTKSGGATEIKSVANPDSGDTLTAGRAQARLSKSDDSLSRKTEQASGQQPLSVGGVNRPMSLFNDDSAFIKSKAALVKSTLHPEVSTDLPEENSDDSKTAGEPETGLNQHISHPPVVPGVLITAASPPPSRILQPAGHPLTHHAKAPSGRLRSRSPDGKKPKVIRAAKIMDADAVSEEVRGTQTSVSPTKTSPRSVHDESPGTLLKHQRQLPAVEPGTKNLIPPVSRDEPQISGNIATGTEVITTEEPRAVKAQKEQRIVPASPSLYLEKLEKIFSPDDVG